MGVPFCKVVDWFCEACAKFFMSTTKMNFWYMRLLTELLMLLDELDLERFLFSCCLCVSRVVLEKMGFSCENRCLSVFANNWLWKVLRKLFWDGWNLNFSTDYDRVKCQECVGENGTEIRLTVWILHAKWWKRKNGKYLLSGEHGHVCTGTGRAYTLFSLAWAMHAVRTSFSAFFVLFHSFLFWIGLWRKH